MKNLQEQGDCNKYYTKWIKKTANLSHEKFAIFFQWTTLFIAVWSPLRPVTAGIFMGELERSLLPILSYYMKN